MITSKSLTSNDIVEFDDRPNAKLRYRLNKKHAPGVTTFIKAGLPTSEALIGWKIGKGAEYVWNELTTKDAGDKDALIKEAKYAWKKAADEAAGIGVIIHDYAYLVSLGKHEEALELLAKHEGTDQWKEILNAVYKVDDFNKSHKDEILHLETIVASTAHNFAGRFDRLVRRDGLVMLSDYKTSKCFYLDQFIQDAAYSIAIKEWLGIEVQGYEVIRFGKEKGDFQQLVITDPQELESFKTMALGCLTTYSWMKEWGKDRRFK